MKIKLADGTEVEVETPKLDDLLADPQFKADYQSRIQATVADRLKNKPKPEPTVDPEVLKELEATRARVKELEDAGKSEIEKLAEANAKALKALDAEKARVAEIETKAKSQFRDYARGRGLRDAVDALKAAGKIAAHAKAEHIVRLVGDAFEVQDDGTLVAKDDLGRQLDAQTFLSGWVSQEDNAAFAPPMVPGPGGTPGRSVKPSDKPLTAQERIEKGLVDRGYRPPAPQRTTAAAPQK